MKTTTTNSFVCARLFSLLSFLHLFSVSNRSFGLYEDFTSTHRTHGSNRATACPSLHPTRHLLLAQVACLSSVCFSSSSLLSQRYRVDTRRLRTKEAVLSAHGSWIIVGSDASRPVDLIHDDQVRRARLGHASLNLCSQMVAGRVRRAAGRPNDRRRQPIRIHVWEREGHHRVWLRSDEHVHLFELWLQSVSCSLRPGCTRPSSYLLYTGNARTSSTTSTASRTTWFSINPEVSDGPWDVLRWHSFTICFSHRRLWWHRERLHRNALHSSCWNCQLVVSFHLRMSSRARITLSRRMRYRSCSTLDHSANVSSVVVRS